MEKTSPFSRIMPVYSAVRLNEAGYVSPSCSLAAVLRDIFTMVTKCSCPGSDALRALPTSWWPALYNRLSVRANICLRDPHLCIHKHTHTYFPKGLITASHENGPMHTRSEGRRVEARVEPSQQCPLHQSGAGTRLPVIRSMRYVVGMWDFFSFSFFFFFMKGSLPRRNGFAGLL